MGSILRVFFQSAYGLGLMLGSVGAILGIIGSYRNVYEEKKEEKENPELAKARKEVRKEANKKAAVWNIIAIVIVVLTLLTLYIFSQNCTAGFEYCFDVGVIIALVGFLLSFILGIIYVIKRRSYRKELENESEIIE